jgi:hypothetical protein
VRPEEIELGLAAHGVPLFVSREAAQEAGSVARPAELIGACLGSGRSRYRMSLIPLLLQLDQATATDALRRAAADVDSKGLRWLRWITLAAEYLAEVYRSEFLFLLGRAPPAPSGVFARGDLPAPEVAHGEWGLRALAEEIGATEGPEVDWAGSLERPVRNLIDHLWFERGCDRARAG